MADTARDITTIVYAAKPGADQPWAVDSAAQLARETQARVAVVSVDDLETEKLATLPRSDVQQLADEAADRAVEGFRAAGLEATKTVLAGPAIEQIMAFADQEDADLIVVGSSTRTPLAQRLLGSVSLSLVQQSSRSVVVVHEPRTN
jgi:nucleotide-binding universal stress UspA family protein